MTETSASYRRILKSSSIIGGASFLNITIGLVRTKVLAVLLGPSGMGLVSLYRGLMVTASSVATMGVDVIGTRQIAEANAKEDARSLAVARRALFWVTVMLGSVGALIVWSLRSLLAQRVLGSVVYANAVGWLAVGVALTVVAASQGALIQGMRRIADLARAGVFSATLNTVVGIAVIWKWGESALVFFVVLTPLATFLLNWWYASRLPKPGTFTISVPEMSHQWKMLLRIGVAFMGATVATSLIQLWIRVDVGNVLGTHALGQFQASWTISQQYIDFILAAMAADYYPRLTGTMHDKNASIHLINHQTEIALLLGGPVFIAMMALAPFVIRLLYTAAFAPAVEVLRWQILSDVLKIASWPLAFLLLAAGDGKTFFWTEVSALLVMGITVTGLLRIVGLEITGVAFLACYVFYLPLVYWLARRRIAFRWSASVVRLLITTFSVCVAVDLLVRFTRWGTIIGCVASVLYAIHALGRLSHMGDLGGPIGRIGTIARRLTGSRIM
jgi:O-antigen/teichoic acid export membrane protein